MTDRVAIVSGTSCKPARATAAKEAKLTTVWVLPTDSHRNVRPDRRCPALRKARSSSFSLAFGPNTESISSKRIVGRLSGRPRPGTGPPECSERRASACGRASRSPRAPGSSRCQARGTGRPAWALSRSARASSCAPPRGTWPRGRTRWGSRQTCRGTLPWRPGLRTEAWGASCPRRPGSGTAPRAAQS